jgi:hypothetical protein
MNLDAASPERFKGESGDNVKKSLARSTEPERPPYGPAGVANDRMAAPLDAVDTMRSPLVALSLGAAVVIASTMVSHEAFG